MERPVYLPTWQLWRGLRHPPYNHPLFRHIRQQAAMDYFQLPFWLVAGAIAAVILLVLLSDASLTIFAIMLLTIAVPLVVLLANGTLFGIAFTIEVTQTLHRTALNFSEALLKLTPMGGLGSAYLIAAACLHRKDRLNQLNRVVRLCVIGTIAGAIIAMLLVLLTLSPANANGRVFDWRLISGLLGLIAGALLLYLDHIQSMVLATLIGMLATRLTLLDLGKGIAAGVLFALAQAGSYAVVLLASLSLGVILQHTAIDGGPAAHVGLTLTLYYLLREGLITLLWHRLIQDHDATFTEACTMLYRTFDRSLAS